MKRLILLLVALVVAIAAPSPAVAYLHVENARSACGATMYPYADAWLANNGYNHVVVWTNNPYASHRYSDSSIVVHAAYNTGGYGGQAEVRCWVTGSDAAPGVNFNGTYPYWGYLGRDPAPSCPGTRWNAWCFMDTFS